MKNLTVSISNMVYISSMALSDPSVHIHDLIVLYQSTPDTWQRDKVIEALKVAYLYATSDELQVK